MTPDQRLRVAMATLHWQQFALVEETGVSQSTARRWYRGITEPPITLVEWIEARADNLQHNPAPDVRPPMGRRPV
jgi:transcriptional regulator with XRE-family HTH domain